MDRGALHGDWRSAGELRSPLRPYRGTSALEERLRERGGGTANLTNGANGMVWIWDFGTTEARRRQGVWGRRDPGASAWCEELPGGGTASQANGFRWLPPSSTKWVGRDAGQPYGRPFQVATVNASTELRLLDEEMIVKSPKTGAGSASGPSWHPSGRR